MIDSNRQRIAIALLVALAAAIVLSGYRDGEQLEALKADPITGYEPTGGELVNSRERDQGHTMLGMGKLYPAYYSRMFELPPGDPARQLQAALQAAAVAGWVIDPTAYHSAGGALVTSGFKRLPTGRAVLGLTLFPDGPPLGRARGPALLVSVTHDLTPTRAARSVYLAGMSNEQVR